MADPLLFDRRLEELLREVAAQPNSALLRIARPAHLTAILDRPSLTTLSTLDSCAAERELVSAHREELAHALRQLALLLVLESPAASTTCIRHGWRSNDGPTATAAELLALVADRWSGAPMPRSRGGSEFELDLGLPSVESLVEAAANLQPTDQGALVLSLHLLGLGDLERARRLADSVLSRRPSPAHRAVALSHLGVVNSRENRGSEAVANFRDAALASPALIVAVLGWLSTAIDAANFDEALEASALADARLASDDLAVVEYAGLLRAQRRAGIARVDRSSRECALRVANRSTRAAALIAQEMLRDRD